MANTNAINLDHITKENIMFHSFKNTLKRKTTNSILEWST